MSAAARPTPVAAGARENTAGKQDVTAVRSRWTVAGATELGQSDH